MTSILWSLDGTMLAGTISHPDNPKQSVLNFYQVDDDTRQLPAPIAQLERDSGYYRPLRWMDNQKIVLEQRDKDNIEHITWNIQSRQKEEVIYRSTRRRERQKTEMAVKSNQIFVSSVMDFLNNDCSFGVAHSKVIGIQVVDGVQQLVLIYSKSEQETSTYPSEKVGAIQLVDLKKCHLVQTIDVEQLPLRVRLSEDNRYLIGWWKPTEGELRHGGVIDAYDLQTGEHILRLQSPNSRVLYKWHLHLPRIVINFNGNTFIVNMLNRTQHGIEPLSDSIAVYSFAWHPYANKLAVIFRRGDDIYNKEIMLLTSDDLGLSS